MPDRTALCHITLREAIENLCIKTLSLEAQRKMAEFGPLNLFAIVSGEHFPVSVSDYLGWADRAT